MLNVVFFSFRLKVGVSSRKAHRQFDIFTLWVTQLNKNNSFKPCSTVTDAQNSSICYLKRCQQHGRFSALPSDWFSCRVQAPGQVQHTASCPAWWPVSNPSSLIWKPSTDWCYLTVSLISLHPNNKPNTPHIYCAPAETSEGLSNGTELLFSCVKRPSGLSGIDLDMLSHINIFGFM